MRLGPALLRIYPASFRREFGDEMLGVFEDMRRDQGGKAWGRIALDVLMSAPGRWTEEARVRARVSVGLAAVAVAGVAALVVRGYLNRVSGVLMLATIGVTGLALALVSSIRGRGAEHDYGPRRMRWWWVVAGAAGAVMAFMGIGELVREPKKENLFFLVLMLSFAALIFGGMRTRNRVAGNWMIVTGVLPLLPWVWMVAPPILALFVIIMALSDNIRMALSRRTAV